jgi:hypothetical protein
MHLLEQRPMTFLALLQGLLRMLLLGDVFDHALVVQHLPSASRTQRAFSLTIIDLPSVLFQQYSLPDILPSLSISVKNPSRISGFS